MKALIRYKATTPSYSFYIVIDCILIPAHEATTNPDQQIELSGYVAPNLFIMCQYIRIVMMWVNIS